MGSSAMSFAASLVSEPCAHQHGDQPGSGPDHHKHGAGCLACCLGACIAIPDLPPRTVLAATFFAGTSVSYWETEVCLNGRSIRPDPAPPRTSA
jgi:hypothetical protein